MNRLLLIPLALVILACPLPQGPPEQTDPPPPPLADITVQNATDFNVILYLDGVAQGVLPAWSQISGDFLIRPYQLYAESTPAGYFWGPQMCTPPYVWTLTP